MEVSNISSSPQGLVTSGDKNDRQNERQDVAKNLEIAFISEMLSFVGMKEISEDFGGGVGESQFQSFLREQHAKLIVEKGGLGLTEQFANSLVDM